MNGVVGGRSPAGRQMIQSVISRAQMCRMRRKGEECEYRYELFQECPVQRVFFVTAMKIGLIVLWVSLNEQYNEEEY